MGTLPASLHFPKPPFRIDRSFLESPPSVAVVGGYLESVRKWRSAVLAFIGEPGIGPVPDMENLTERARDALFTFLACDWSRPTKGWAAQSPYNISAFPAHALPPSNAPTLELIREVLQWRAGVVDLLCDIWDVCGEPALDLAECWAIEQFLRPTCHERLCIFCLTEFEPKQSHPAQHGCLLTGHVRAKWPEFPPFIKRCIEEAQASGQDPKSEPPRPTI